MQDERCPQCGSPIVTRTEGGSLVIQCTQCPFEALTTDPRTPMSDQTVYSVRISALKNPPPRDAASLAVALGISAATARELLQRGGPIAMDVPAVEVQRLHTLISPLGFSLEIEPHFRWTLD